MRTQSQSLPRSPVAALAFLSALSFLGACSRSVQENSGVEPSRGASVWCPPTNDTMGAMSSTQPDGGTQPPTDECPLPDGGSLAVMNLDLYGLFTNPNPVGQQVPRGGLRKANDIVVDRPGVGSPRRADDYRTPSGDLPSGITNVFDYAGTMFGWSATGGEGLHRGTITSTNTVWTQVSTLDWAAGSLRYATGGGDLYLTSDSGPLVMDGTTATPVVPGVPRATDIYVANVRAAGAGELGWLAASTTVAYRVVWGKNDSEGRPVLGEPSGRLVLPDYNGTSGSAPFVVDLQIVEPAGITAGAGYFFQVYRTGPSSSPDPGDTMFLVWESPYDDVSDLDVTDIAPDGGVPLLTNGDQGGVRNSNVRPPLAQDMTTFRQRLWLANTTGRQTLRLRFISPVDLSDSYTLRVAGVDYVMQGLDPLGGFTVSQRIEYTARELVKTITADTDATVRAYYVSGAYDPPGMIEITANDLGTSPFTVQAIIGGATAGAKFVPNTTTAVASLADEYPNRLHYSKEGVFYGFPLSNTLQVGAEEFAISRVVALRDTLLVFKENGGDGLWKVTGNGPWYVEQVNAGVHLIAPDTVVVANNTAFALTDKGVISVSESGSVDTISVPIEDKLKDIILTRAAEVPFARAFIRESNTEEKVYFGFPDDSNPLSVSESYVWNIATETWTRDTREWTAAFVGPDGRMVRFTEVGESGAFVERNSGNRLADSLGVAYEVEWNTETGDMPDGEKQFSQAAVLYQQAQPLSVDAEMWFTADDGTPGPAVETGGEGFPYIRAEVPFDQQRTTRLGVEIRGTVTTTLADILGMSVTYRTYAPLKGR